MEIPRSQLLSMLQMLDQPGVNTLNITEQYCYTFNGELVIRQNLPEALGMTGAVVLSAMKKSAEKSTADKVQLEFKDGQLVMKIGRSRIGLALLETMPIPPPPKGNPTRVPDGLIAALEYVKPCAAISEQSSLCYLHVTPEYVEACNRFYLSRYMVSSPMEILVSRAAADKLKEIAPMKLFYDNDWIRFVSSKVEVWSRRPSASDSYPDLSPLLTFDSLGELELGQEITEAAAQAAVWCEKAEDSILVELSANKLQLHGQSSGGWATSLCRVKYNGPAAKFRLLPDAFGQLLSQGTTIRIGSDRIGVFSEGKSFIVPTVAEGAKPEQKA